MPFSRGVSSCELYVRYDLDAMMLEVGSFPNSKSYFQAKEEVDKVWTPQMRALCSRVRQHGGRERAVCGGDVGWVGEIHGR